MWSATWEMVAGGIGLPFCHSGTRPNTADRLSGSRPRPAANAFSPLNQSVHSCETKNGTNATMHTPPLTASRASTSSGTLRGLSVSARAHEWEKMTGARGRVQRVVHGGDRDVRQVDEHAEALHLRHDLAAEVRQAAAVRLVGRGVGPADVVVVRQRHVADAKGVQRAEHAERAVDAVAALRAEQGGDLARLERRLHVVGGQRELEAARVGGDHPVHHVDLLEDRRHGRVAREAGRDVDRPELAADPALHQARDVGVRAVDAPGQARLDRVKAELLP